MSVCIDKVNEIVDGLRIEDDKGGLVFKAAVILLYSIANNTVDLVKIKQATGYTYSDVIDILGNFREEGIIIRRKWNVRLPEDDLCFVDEFALLAMTGAGLLECSENRIAEVEIKYPHLKIA